MSTNEKQWAIFTESGFCAERYEDALWSELPESTQAKFLELMQALQG